MLRAAWIYKLEERVAKTWERSSGGSWGLEGGGGGTERRGGQVARGCDFVVGLSVILWSRFRWGRFQGRVCVDGVRGDKKARWDGGDQGVS